jgi:hypothetical protein
MRRLCSVSRCHLGSRALLEDGDRLHGAQGGGLGEGLEGVADVTARPGTSIGVHLELLGGACGAHT